MGAVSAWVGSAQGRVSRCFGPECWPSPSAFLIGDGDPSKVFIVREKIFFFFFFVFALEVGCRPCYPRSGGMTKVADCGHSSGNTETHLGELSMKIRPLHDRVIIKHIEAESQIHWHRVTGTAAQKSTVVGFLPWGLVEFWTMGCQSTLARQGG